MAITYRASTTGAGTTSVTLNKPTGVVDGDLLIVQIIEDGEDVTDPTAPAGWTLLDSVQHSADIFTGSWYWKVASSEPASWTWSGLTNVESLGICDAFYDSVGGGTWTRNASSATQVSTATHSISITSENSSLLYAGFNHDTGATITTPPTGMTQGAFSDGTSVDAVSYYQMITTGAAESKSLTWSSSDVGVAFAGVWTYSATTDTVDTVDTITPGATGLTATYTGFASGSINSATLGDGVNTFALTSVSDDDAGTVTFSCPTIISIGCMFSSATYTVTITLSNGTESANTTATFNPPSGYAVSTPTGTWLTTDEASLAYNWGANVTTADQVIYPTNDSWAVDAAGGHWTTNQTTGTSTLYAIDHTTFSVETFYVYFDPETGKKVTTSITRQMTIGI